MAIFQPSNTINIVLSHGLYFFIVMTLSSIMLKGWEHIKMYVGCGCRYVCWVKINHSSDKYEYNGKWHQPCQLGRLVRSFEKLKNKNIEILQKETLIKSRQNEMLNVLIKIQGQWMSHA